MSHLEKFKSSVTDPAALVRALLKMGLPQSQIECYDQAVKFSGYHDNEIRQANVIVRHRGGRYGSDIGWEKNANGTYDLHGDQYNYKNLGGSQHYSQEWENELYTNYNVEKSKMELEARNIPYTEGRDENGRTTITARFRTDNQQQSQRGR